MNSSMKIIRKLPYAPPYKKVEINPRVFGYKTKHMRVLDYDPHPSPATVQRKPKKRRFDAWPDERYKKLADLYNSGMTYDQIGEAMGRSGGGLTRHIRHCIAKGYITEVRTSRRAWTIEEDTKLIRMHDKGRATDVIAKELDRSRASVQSRLRALRRLE